MALQRPPSTQLWHARTGAAALEFAIVSIPFLGLLFGLVAVSYDLYVQEALDYALQQAVRQVQIGRVPSTSTVATFTATVFCPVFTQFQSCANVAITVQPVADYWTNAAVAKPSAAQMAIGGAFCIGQPGQLMYAQAVYLAPLLAQIWPYGTAATVGGVTGQALVANAAFANENPAGVAIPAGGGC